MHSEDEQAQGIATYSEIEETEKKISLYDEVAFIDNLSKITTPVFVCLIKNKQRLG